MLTAQELYDVERTRVVKNITLLKALKAKIVEENSKTTQMANITRELHQAESEEEWDRYDQLQQQLAQLTQQTDATDPPSTIILTLTLTLTLSLTLTLTLTLSLTLTQLKKTSELKMKIIQQNIWARREGALEETWEESRIGRITGTTAKIIMTGKNKPSGLQLAQIFGLSTFPATTQMQIGTILETKIMQAYCNLQKLQLKKVRGGSILSLLYQYRYVGHTPDGKTKNLKDDEGEVLEVKVVFGTQDPVSTIFKKHKDQLNLGLFVHRCRLGRLLVYRCNSEMTLREAERHEVKRK